MIWRERWVLLTVLAVLLAINVVYFFTYRVQFQNRVDDFEARRGTAENQLAQARAARLRTERTYEAYRSIERDANTIFEDHWSTQPRRFTLLVAEVKRLTAASNMTPPRIAFQTAAAVAAPAPDSKTSRGAAIGAKEVGIGFTVTGTYAQVRRLINLLELSRQFVIIDQISLSSHEGSALTLNLHLKTLFRDEAAPVAQNRL